MSHSEQKILLDYICEILRVKYDEEFQAGGNTYKIIKYRLMRKYPHGFVADNFENIFRVIIDV